MGFGTYHSGIEVNGTEYSFSQGGIFPSTPKDVPGLNLRETVLVGYTNLLSREINDILSDMRSDYPGNSYHVVLKYDLYNYIILEIVTFFLMILPLG